MYKETGRAKIQKKKRTTKKKKGGDQFEEGGAEIKAKKDAGEGTNLEPGEKQYKRGKKKYGKN